MKRKLLMAQYKRNEKPLSRVDEGGEVVTEKRRKEAVLRVGSRLHATSDDLIDASERVF